MKPKLSCACLLVVVSTVGAAAPDIPDVRTLDDLLAVTPVEAAEGWSVRLGLSDAGPAGGPVVVLYCWAERRADVPATRPATRPVLTGEPLGPLQYEVKWEGQLFDKMKSRLKMLHREPLYAATVQIAQTGKASVVVRDAAGTVIGERALVVTEGRPVSTSRPSTEATTQPLLSPLVHIPDDAAPQSYFSLELAERAFVLRMAGQTLSDTCDEELLARWWVNGKPVISTMWQRQDTLRQMRQQRMLPQLHVALGLPDFLGELKPGDRVGLQLLYSPDGSEPVLSPNIMRLQGNVRARLKDEPRWPVLSNRIDFELTEALLEEKDHPLPTRQE